MNVYTDYQSWKKENIEFINSLIKAKNHILTHFTHVFAVIEYLANKQKKSKSVLIDDEEMIFKTAFEYLHNHFLNLTTILSAIFKDNFEEFNKARQSIQLLVYINDFQNDFQSHDSTEFIMLDSLEQKIITRLENKEAFDISLNDELNEALNHIVMKKNKEYLSINQILYEVSLEYGLMIDDDEKNQLSYYQKLFKSNV